MYLRNLDDEDNDQIKQNIEDLLFYCLKVRPFMGFTECKFQHIT